MASSSFAHLGDLSPILSFLGWWFLPGLLSGFVLGLFYRIFPSRRPILSPSTSDQKPIFNPSYQLEKLEFERKSRLHRSFAHGFVISIYLIYTLINIYQDQSGSNYYSILGLKSNSLAFNSPLPGSATPSSPVLKSKSKVDINKPFLDEAGLKSHWRKLARSFHPDKLNPPPQLQSEIDISKWKDEVQSKFIDMREAYEILNDETKQWAYDRFGPIVATWKNCVTMREYLLEGLKYSAPFWLFTLTTLSLIASIRRTDPGAFWRWTCLMAILVSEVIIITSSSITPISKILSRIFPNRAPFQHLQLLRQIFIASSSVTTQLSSILYPVPPELTKNQNVGDMIAPIFSLVERAQEVSTLANVEVIKLIFNDLHPVIRKHDSGTSSPDSQNHQSGEESKETKDIENDESSEEVLELKEIVKDLKAKMLDTFCDLKLQSDPIGQAAWIQAIHQHMN